MLDYEKEALKEVPEEDHTYVCLAATRRTNMAGGRYSDNLRSEVYWYKSKGRDSYIAEWKKERGQ